MAYKHPEAFCHMLYQCESCRNKEWIWNSRDGVTPFVVPCQRCGGSMTHINWNMDRVDPEYQPIPGQRIFIDLTEERFVDFMFTRMRDAGHSISRKKLRQQFRDDVKSQGEPGPDIKIVPATDGAVQAI